MVVIVDKRDSELRKTIVCMGGRCMRTLNLIFGWFRKQSEDLGGLM